MSHDRLGQPSREGIGENEWTTDREELLCDCSEYHGQIERRPGRVDRAGDGGDPARVYTREDGEESSDHG